MACPLCGERCTCSYADLPQSAPAQPAAGSHVAVLIDPENFQDSEQRFLASLEMPPVLPELSAASQPEFYRADGMWREEVASRVDAYRAKRGRRRPDRSSLLSFDFDSPQTSERELPIAVNADSTWEPPASVIEMPPPALPESKIIEFPRQSVPEPEPEPDIQFLVDELADPIIETPRILEAPPEDAAPPVFGGVSLAPITLEEHSVQIEHMDLRVAARGLRIFSGLVDALLVGIASALFAMIFIQMTDSMPHTRFALALMVVVPSLFWAAYQYTFLVYSAATPGMHLAHLKLSTFEGGRVYPAQRRGRALAMLLSCISVGFGFAWAFLDPDGLCWHDKITRTYLTQRTY